MKLTAPQPNAKADKKLAELILHVSTKCSEDRKFGATKLNKILFFADCISFVRNGRTISESKFMRLGNGPVPKRLLPVREKLIDAKRLAIQPVPLLDGKTQQRPVALDSANLDAFSPKDIELLDFVIAGFQSHTAQEISDFSHTMPAWQIANDNEDIPIEAAFISSLRPSQSDEAVALELEEKHGW